MIKKTNSYIFLAHSSLKYNFFLNITTLQHMKYFLAPSSCISICSHKTKKYNFVLHILKYTYIYLSI